MIFLILFLCGVLIALGTGVMAGISDFRGLTIPNSYHLIIIGGFILSYGAVYVSGVPLMSSIVMHLLAAISAFVVTFILFQVGVIGGGDSKLITVYALWISFIGMPVFLFDMALLGAVLGIIALIIKRKAPFKEPKEGSWIARVQAGESQVPYGIPIAFGAFLSFLDLGYLSPETFKLFLGG